MLGLLCGVLAGCEHSEGPAAPAPDPSRVSGGAAPAAQLPSSDLTPPRPAATADGGEDVLTTIVTEVREPVPVIDEPEIPPAAVGPNVPELIAPPVDPVVASDPEPPVVVPETPVSVEDDPQPPDPPPPNATVLEACATGDASVPLPQLPGANALPTPHYALHFDDFDELMNPALQLKVLDAKGLPIKGETDLGQVWHLKPGRRGSALQLDGAILAVPVAAALPSPAGSVSLWVQSNSFYGSGNRRVLFLQSDNNGEGWNFQLGNHATQWSQLQLVARQSGVEQDIMLPIAGWAPGEWHHLAVTWTAEHRVRLFIDGRLRAERVAWNNFPTLSKAPNHLYLLSSRRTPQFPVLGDGAFLLDEFATFAEALAPHQIIALYNGGLDTAGTTVTAGRLALHLLGSNDGYGISGLVDATSGRKTTLAAPREWWRLTLTTPSAAGDSTPPIEWSFANTATASAQRSCGRDPDSGVVTVTWQGIALPSLKFGAASGGLADVAVQLTPDAATHAVRATIAVALDSAQWSLKSVAFPTLTGVAPVGPTAARTALLLPGSNIGSLVHDPFVHPLRRVPAPAVDRITKAQNWPTYWDLTGVWYPGRDLGMQWFGLFDELAPVGGLYVAVEDGIGFMKALQFRHDLPAALTSALLQNDGALPDPALALEVLTLAENIGQPGNDYTQTWPTVLALQDGRWYDFARRYRTEFAQQQPWMQAGTLAQRDTGDDLPRWMAEAGLNQPSADGAIVAQYSQMLQAKGHAGAVMWHWSRWQEANRFASQQTQMNDAPSVVPWTSFEKYRQQVKTADAKTPVVLYSLPTRWDAVCDVPPCDPALWSGSGDQLAGLSSAMRRFDGSVIMGNDQLTFLPIPTGAPPLQHHVRMCPAAVGWQQVVTKSVQRMIGEYHVEGVYHDELAALTPTPCFNPDHGHAPGGGAFYVQGLRTMVTAARAAAKQLNPQAGFYTEGFSEPYLDVIDGFYTEAQAPTYVVQEGGAEVVAVEHVPLAPIVYHDYTQFIGLSVAKKYHTVASIVARQGTWLTWGGMPGPFVWNTDCNPLNDPTCDPPKEVRLRDYAFTLAQYRRQFREDLVFGEMLPPPTLRWSKTAVGGNGAAYAATISAEPLPMLRTPVFESFVKSSEVMVAPVAVASAWSAPSKTIGVVVTSLHSEQSMTILLPLDAVRPFCATATPQVTVHRLAGDTALPPLGNQAAIRVDLAAAESVLVELE